MTLVSLRLAKRKRAAGPRVVPFHSLVQGLDDPAVQFPVVCHAPA